MRRSTSWPSSPNLKTIAGLNYDYAYGRDSWDVFKRTILKLKPDVQVVGELWTKFLATEYSAEISRLLAAKPDVIHTVNWGAGLTSFINQGETRGLFEQSLVMMTTGLLNQAEILPKGAAFSGRGYHLQYPDPDKNAGNSEYLRSYKAKFNSLPDYQGTFMAQAFYGLKAAIEKSVKVKNGAWPTTEEIAAAMEGLEFDTPRGRVLVRKDHEAVHEAMWGLTSDRSIPRSAIPSSTNSGFSPPPMSLRRRARRRSSGSKAGRPGNSASALRGEGRRRTAARSAERMPALASERAPTLRVSARCGRRAVSHSARRGC